MWFLISSFDHVVFKFWTSLILIMECVWHQFDKSFSSIFKNASFGNLNYVSWFWRKKRESITLQCFGVVLNLKWWSIYRPMSLKLLGTSTSFWKIKDALRGKNDFSKRKKEASSFYHVWKSHFDPISSQLYLADIYQLNDQVGKFVLLLDEENSKWPIIDVLNFEKHVHGAFMFQFQKHS